MRVLVAELAGLCFGVRRALALVDELAARRGAGRVVTLGPLCHNRAVVDRLRTGGVEPIDPDAPLEAGTVAVVRSHGLPRETVERLRAEGATVHDGTCPHVRSAQTIAGRMAGQGYRVLVAGESTHPEVVSILSHARGGEAPSPIAIADPSEVRDAIAGVRKVAVLAQTTSSRTRWAAVVAACLEAGPVEVRAFDTICEETVGRQREAVELASGADLVLVVGGRESANTRRLAELCAERCSRCHQLESAEEIDPGWLRGVETVAVTAGASTPAASVTAIVERLRALDGEA
jgi:4-hydroxy-3-methylbut-2-enyl diphosphate reductase